MQRDIEITICKDDSLPGFGAWLAGSGQDGQATILLNVHASFKAFDGDDNATREALLQILMHEFGHAMEEFLNLEFSEERVQTIAESYPNIEFVEEDVSG